MFEVEWTGIYSDEGGSSKFLAKSERHAKAIFRQFNPDKVDIAIMATSLKSDGVYDIHTLKQIKEGDTFYIVKSDKDRYFTDVELYVKGPFDPTKSLYQIYGDDSKTRIKHASPQQYIVPIHIA